MPDTRAHRGAHPEDAFDFAPEKHAMLRTAALDLSWLLGRGYSDVAALKLVGDKFQLSVRQRNAIMRSAASDEACALRARKRVDLSNLRGARLGIDTFNCLITIEACLGGGVVMLGRDGVLRDISSVHGTYRRVEETLPALALIAKTLTQLGVAEARFYLDRPVGNSGRLRALIEESLGAAPFVVTASVRDDVDRTLVAEETYVASSDSWILDHAQGFFDLPMTAIGHAEVSPLLVDLRG